MKSNQGNTPLIYGVMVLIWGTSWIGVKWQCGHVEELVSIVYRFALASIILLIYTWLKGMPVLRSIRTHLILAAQGIFMFGLNYLLFYKAISLVGGGMPSLIFSSLIVMNMINGLIFLRMKTNLKTLAGALIGLCGIGLIFLPEISGLEFQSSQIQGLLLSLGGSYLFSLGNMIAHRYPHEDLSVLQTTAYGMFYGSLCLTLITLVSGVPFAFEWTIRYIGSLIYLSLAASIVAFGFYLLLIRRIGVTRTAYSALMIPIIAMVLSSISGTQEWSLLILIGTLLVLIGNFIVMLHHQQVKTV